MILDTSNDINIKKKKKHPTVIIKANKKILMQISNSLNFLLIFYIVFINHSNGSRYTSFLKRKKKEEKQ